jgi:hypothetical protein
MGVDPSHLPEGLTGGTSTTGGELGQLHNSFKG